MNPKNQMMQQTAKQFVNSDWGEGVSELLAAKEQDLLEKVAALADATDHDTPDLGASAGARAEQLRQGVEAIIGGNFPQWYVSEMVDAKNTDRIAALAAKDDADLTQRMDGWVSAYRNNGGSGLDDMTDREIVARHVERKYGLALEAFARLVHWRDGQRARAIEDVLLGGMNRAEESIEEMTAAAENGGGE